MSNDNYLSSMYSGNLYHGKDSAKVPTRQSPDKMASRVIGGLKAQNAHMQTFDINGQSVTFPRAEYVTQLETQVKEARKKIQDLETKQTRLIKANNTIMNRLREIERELANKLDIK